MESEPPMVPLDASAGMAGMAEALEDARVGVAVGDEGRVELVRVPGRSCTSPSW